MSQSSISSYYSTRKRIPPVDDPTSIKNKLLNETSSKSSTVTLSGTGERDASPIKTQEAEVAKLTTGMRTRAFVQKAANKRSATPSTVVQATVIGNVSPKKQAKREQMELDAQQTKLVQFIKKGTLSPRKKSSTISRQEMNESTPNSGELKNHRNEQQSGQGENRKSVDEKFECIHKTPTKQIIKGSDQPLRSKVDLKSQVKKELKFDEVKSKITRSAKLQELKASLNRIKSLEETRKLQEAKNKALKEGISAAKDGNQTAVQLKKFDTIEVEVLVSPKKSMKTPTKVVPSTPDKNDLMSPRHTNVSKRILFSPSKDGSVLSAKVVVPPAYQRFLSLAETSKAGQLPLPFKYRNLLEIFKGLDCVCAMFHNRKECITFKKIKTSVQRMLRKNFTETNLAQIKHIYPQAYTFCQMKMRNYGSASKTDYFQLVITPNLENSNSGKVTGDGTTSEVMNMNSLANIINEDDVMTSAQKSIMNPHIMTKRLQHFHNLLLERVKEEHDQYLRSLVPPLIIAKNKITRWHPDFDLEGCSDIELGVLPQPPNVEKFSSAKDILATARNLFNCGTPMEKALARYEAKVLSKKTTETKDKDDIVESSAIHDKNSKSVDLKSKENLVEKTADFCVKEKGTNLSGTQCRGSEKGDEEKTVPTSNLLKGIPKSLLEKIRARQAAKELDAITRRPSQDEEAAKYARLPKLARHVRNVFITERKGVLMQEMLIAKIQNSYGCWLGAQEIEHHLQLLTKAVPEWAALHEVRKTTYLKISKDMDMKIVIEKLENLANEKSKM